MQHRVDATPTKPTGTGTLAPSEDLIRLGDARAAAGDWIGAVARWRAAGEAGAEPAAIARLRAFVEQFGGTPSEDARIPPPALGPLAVCVGATVLGTLAFVAAGRPGGGIYPILLALGWVGVAIACGSALDFALRSGRPADGTTPAAIPEPVDLEELAARAEALAARLTRREDKTTGSKSAAAR